MWKWPILAVMLVACSGDDELEAPMLGDCTSCTHGPAAGGGASGPSDAAVGFDANNEGTVDVIDIVDVGVSGEGEGPSDVLDIVDIGVPNDI